MRAESSVANKSSTEWSPAQNSVPSVTGHADLLQPRAASLPLNPALLGETDIDWISDETRKRLMMDPWVWDGSCADISTMLQSFFSRSSVGVVYH